MKKLNNKGFAITATLYSVLIFFILILLSLISVLASKKNFYDNITDSTKDYLEMSIQETPETVTLNSTNSSYTTTENAKYRLELQNFACEIYLPKNVNITITGNPITSVEFTKVINGEQITVKVIEFNTTYKLSANSYYKFITNITNSSVTDRNSLIISKIAK